MNPTYQLMGLLAQALTDAIRQARTNGYTETQIDAALACLILLDCQFRDNGTWYDAIDEQRGGGSTRGGFHITVDGHRFGVSVFEYDEDE